MQTVFRASEKKNYQQKNQIGNKSPVRNTRIETIKRSDYRHRIVTSQKACQLLMTEGDKAHQKRSFVTAQKEIFK